VLAQENTAQVAAFLQRHPDYKIIPYTDQWRNAIGGEPPVSADDAKDTLLLTPARHGTDGFFVAVIGKG
jgi:16S rRNA (cytosine967-C5)-methyltransferase